MPGKKYENWENVTPYVGIEFSYQEVAYDFHNYYAKKKGFNIRMSNYYRSRKTNSIACRKFICSKEGEKDLKDKKKDGKGYQES